MTYRPDTHALNMATGLSCPGTSRAHRDTTGKKAQGSCNRKRRECLEKKGLKQAGKRSPCEGSRD